MTSSNFITNLKDITFFTKISGQFMIIRDHKKKRMNKQPKFDYSNIKFKDNGKLKLIIVVGTRPEIIRLAAVINKCRQYFDVILAHTGQN